MAIFIESFDDETSAVKAMQVYARNLRRLKRTDRYGVFIEKKKGVWWLCLADRQKAL